MNERPTGIVLAGGKSSRFGGDKALAELGGQPLLFRALDLLTKLCGEIIVVGRTGVEISNMRVRAIDDLMPNLGPISGLHTGLSDSKTELNLVLAVDMPFVTVSLFETLLNSIGNASAAIPEADGRMQPLCAVYRRSCLPMIESFISHNGRAVFGFLDRVEYCRVHFEQTDILDDVDTREQWIAAEKRLSERKS